MPVTLLLLQPVEPFLFHCQRQWFTFHNQSTPIRVLITDDHEVVRTGLRAFMQIEPDIEVVGEASNGREAVALVNSLQPDIVLMDLVMPEMSGTEAIREITENDPGSILGNTPKTRIIAVTSFSEEDKVFPAIKAGAMGYVLKDTPPQALIQAIHQVHCGESSLDPTAA
ncbi:MAG: response regulator transcription factor [Chloroflexota bacterium]